MQNIKINFISYFFAIRICWHSTRDICWCRICHIFWIAFASVANTLSVAFIISLHILTKVSGILFKYLPFSQIHVPDSNYNLSCKYNAFYTRFIIPFLIWTTCCTIEFAFTITWICFTNVLASFIVVFSY